MRGFDSKECVEGVVSSRERRRPMSCGSVEYRYTRKKIGPPADIEYTSGNAEEGMIAADFEKEGWMNE